MQRNEAGEGSNPFLQKQLASRSLVVEASVPAKHALTPQPGLPDHAAQGAALVGGALVAEEHGAGLDDPLGRVVEDTDIGVEADAQIALAGFQADLGGGVGAAEAHDVLERVLGVLVVGGGCQALATAELGPEDGEAQAHGGDAAPGGEEVAVLFHTLVAGAVAGDVRGELLQVGCAGGVVGDDGLDDTIAGVLLQFLPQAVLVQLGADGWAALVAGVAVPHFLGGQREVVEAGLGSDLDALCASFPQEGNGFHSGKVDNVQLKVGGEVSHRQDPLNSACLEFRRPGCQEGRVGLQRASRGSWWFRCLSLVTNRLGDWGYHLCMEHQGSGLVCQFSHSFLDIFLAHSGELVHLNSMLVPRNTGVEVRDHLHHYQSENP